MSSGIARRTECLHRLEQRLALGRNLLLTAESKQFSCTLSTPSHSVNRELLDTTQLPLLSPPSSHSPSFPRPRAAHSPTHLQAALAPVPPPAAELGYPLLAVRPVLVADHARVEGVQRDGILLVVSMRQSDTG